MSGHQPKPEECECCGFETDQLTETDAFARTQGHGPFTPDEEKEWGWLCDVCRSTLVGNVFLYPRQYDATQALVLPTIAWGINRLLHEIRRTFR